jgi:hypothetical protein
MTIFELLLRPWVAGVAFREALGGGLGIDVRRRGLCAAARACLRGLAHACG